MSVFNDFIGWLGKKMMRNAALGPFATIGLSLRDIDSVNKGNSSGSTAVDSWLNSQTQAGPTGRDLWLSNREDTVNQRTVADLQAAGLNPALMYNGGASQVPVSSASSGNPAGLSDIIQLAMLPLQMENLRADTERTLADAGNIEQRTRTEEFVTQLRSLALDWYPKMTQAEFDKLLADTNVAYSRHRNLEFSSDLISSQKEAQDITNSYLPSRLDSEIQKISAEKEYFSSFTKLNLMRESFEKIQRDFAFSNRFLMSSSDSLLIVTYIANLLGLSTGSIAKFIKEDVPRIVDETVKASHLGSPGGPHM